MIFLEDNRLSHPRDLSLKIGFLCYYPNDNNAYKTSLVLKDSNQIAISDLLQLLLGSWDQFFEEQFAEDHLLPAFLMATFCILNKDLIPLEASFLASAVIWSAVNILNRTILCKIGSDILLICCILHVNSCTNQSN